MAARSDAVPTKFCATGEHQETEIINTAISHKSAACAPFWDTHSKLFKPTVTVTALDKLAVRCGSKSKELNNGKA